MNNYSKQYQQSATAIIQAYDGSVPLAAWLKEYFRQHKKMGSRDRKAISHLCYCFYRLGGCFSHVPISERIIIGLFLCATEPNELMEGLRPVWNPHMHLTAHQKLALVDAPDEWWTLFPERSEVSDAIQYEAFALSHWLQPLLYLRLRPGREEVAAQKLHAASLSYERISSHCIGLPNNTNVERLIELNEEAVVQDQSSQEVLQTLIKQPLPQKFRLWDCCAASGGKSILAYDLFPGVHITATDVRTSILHNLRNRFAQAGIHNYESFVWDSSPKPLDKKFDVVLCDAPCSGSGTWGRTPEGLHFFTEQKLIHYQQLQQRIAVNAAQSVKSGGYFVYITCSVYTAKTAVSGISQGLYTPGRYVVCCFVSVII